MAGELIQLWDALQMSIIEPDENYTEPLQSNIGVCPVILSEETLRIYLLFPAVICVVILAFTQKRRYMFQGCLNGRPGLLLPMDILSRSQSLSYAAAFGILSDLCYSVILEQRYAFQYTGPTYLKVFVALLSMFIYGVAYFPLFAALNVQSPLGYFIGTLFSWAYAAVYILNSLICYYDLVDYLTLIINEAPIMVCHTYLVFSLPIRFVWSFKRKPKNKLAVDFESSKDLFDSIRNSYQGIHVRKLYAKPPPPKSPPEGVCGKILDLLKTVAEKVIYKRESNFRYSTRMFSVMTVSFLIIYYITVGLLRLFLWLTHAIMQKIDYGLEYVQYVSFLQGYQTEATSTLQFLKDVILNARVILVVSTCITFVIGAVMILHSLANYRFLLQQLYKGDCCHLTPKKDMSHSSSLVGSMRYAGYQVGYIAWGYLIQFLVLIVIGTIISTIIQLWPFLKDWILDKLMALWPVVLTSLVVNLIQMLLAKLVFLQKRGNVLALDNRRLFFIVSYFMFFYNIFIGLVSCLMRILKSIVLGALFLPRLDHSTLPRKFQTLDPGFHAYCGFMHVENAHTHPVIMVFISILQAESFNTIKARSKQASDDYILGDMEGGGQEVSRSYHRAKWKWLLAYTLVQNPVLCLERKIVLAKQKNESIIHTILNDGYHVKSSSEKSLPINSVNMTFMNEVDTKI